MVLNSCRFMPALSSRYCGIALYPSNACCHCASLNGGNVPVTGFHSTIERPDSVSRVAPPTSTMMAISAATEMSHHLTAPACAACCAELELMKPVLKAVLTRPEGALD